jgi:hypothetical protein
MVAILGGTMLTKVRWLAIRLCVVTVAFVIWAGDARRKPPAQMPRYARHDTIALRRM